MTDTSALPVHPSNADQFRAWDGDEGAYWAAHADYFDRSVQTHHGRLLDAAAIAVQEHVLDVGCGTGQLTRDAARLATAGSALGVDLSGAMLAHARRRADADGLTNVAFEQADAQVYPFESASFDIAVSRSGAMFFGDPVAAFTNIGRALRPGGRIVLMTWQPLAGNEWIREFSGALAAGRDIPTPPPGAPGPFALSEPDRVRTILTEANYRDIDLDGFSAGMWFGSDADEASKGVLGVLGWMLEGLDDAGRTHAVDALRASTAGHETADGVLYESAAWIIRASRR